mmetsp:Transcript_17364/g.53425  ORF Transcript_17364/g.53425 Transcript_17364/m.53425 type:complete len:96 (-) Transcript_17364:241-528(-)
MVELLLDRGADGHRAKANGAQPLHVAVAAGHVDAAALLLDRVEVDRANLFGWTALYVACKNGRRGAALSRSRRGLRPVDPRRRISPPRRLPIWPR